MLCAISEIRTLVSDGCLDHVCTELVNPEPGLLHYVGISVDFSGTFTDIKHSATFTCYKPNRKQLLINLGHESIQCSGWRGVTVMNGAFSFLPEPKKQKDGDKTLMLLGTLALVNLQRQIVQQTKKFAWLIGL